MADPREKTEHSLIAAFRHTVGSNRHTAGPRNRICMHIGCKITYFHINRQFRVMNVNRCIGICLLQFSANVLAELNGACFALRKPAPPFLFVLRLHFLQKPVIENDAALVDSFPDFFLS